MTSGTYSVTFINTTTNHKFNRQIWAMNLDHLYERINEQLPYLKLASGPDVVTRIA